MRVSAQLYTVRHCGDLSDQLQLAAACGFTDVETTGLHQLSAGEMAQTVRQSGLRVRSAHFDWEEFEDRFPEILDALHLLECPVAVMPWLAPEARPDTAKGWIAVSGQLSEWAERLSRRSVKLAYHNHDFDVQGDAGETPLDLILSRRDLYWQPDIGWLVAAGLDPSHLIRRYGDRILSIHAKDVNPTEQGDARWRDPGDGVVDWTAVLRSLRATRCTDLFVEHDESPDPGRTLQKGWLFLMKQMEMAA